MAFASRERTCVILCKYRNLIHPEEQLKLNYHPNAGSCSLSRDVIRYTMQDITKWIEEHPNTTS